MIWVSIVEMAVVKSFVVEETSVVEKFVKKFVVEMSVVKVMKLVVE
jgi:hypothetical protein